jgi:hypothetical protein
MISSLRQKIAGFLDRRCARGRERVRKTGQQHRNSRRSFQARAIASPRRAAFLGSVARKAAAMTRSTGRFLDTWPLFILYALQA